MRIFLGRAIAAVLISVFVAVPPARAAAAQAGKTPPAVRVGGEVKPPACIKDSQPVYPPAALAAGIQGVVIIEATIGVDGKVTATKVIRSLSMLEDAAVKAVKGRQYKPTLINGVATPVIMTVPVIFKPR
jgi:protein TonB